MKWIGQNIWDWASRFRNDVYLEDVSTGTIASGGNLGLDSNNKIVKASASGGISFDGSTANGVLTYKDADEATVESNLTFTGSVLNLEGIATFSSGSTSGGAALLLEQADVDQNAFSITGSNTTAHLINLTANALTTGSGIYLDIANSRSDIYVDKDVTSTVNLTHGGSFYTEITKTVNTASGQTTTLTGFGSVLSDSGVNVGTSTLIGNKNQVSMSNNDGTTSAYGIYNSVTGSADISTGIYQNVVNGGIDLHFVSSANTDDSFKLNTTTNGATTLTTSDADAALAHFEIAADGNITLDAAGDIALEAAGNDVTVDSDTLTITSSTADYPQVKLSNTTDDNQASQLIFDKLRADDGVATGQNLGEIWFNGQDGSQNAQSYAYIVGEIDVSTHGQESGQLVLGVASHDGTNQTGLTLTGGSVSGEVDAAIGRGSASTTTVAGDLSITTGLILDSVDVTTIQTSSESFADNDTSLMTSAAIDDKINTKYSYAYMTWSASAKPTRDGSNNPEWMLPNTSKGIYEEDWNNDSGVTATSTGTTTYALSRFHAVNSLVIPHDGILVGFHGHGRNDDSDLTFKAGLFHADGSTTSGTNATGIDYGNTAANNEFTLRCVATADEAESSGGADGTSNHSFKAPCKLVSNTVNLTVSAGDALLPAIMGNSSNSTDEIFVTMTIILKIPLTT